MGHYDGRRAGVQGSKIQGQEGINTQMTNNQSTLNRRLAVLSTESTMLRTSQSNFMRKFIINNYHFYRREGKSRREALDLAYWAYWAYPNY